MYKGDRGLREVFDREGVLVIGGPCAIEGRDMAFRVCEGLLKGCQERGLDFVYKGSFDKANRMRVDSARGIGIDEGLRILADIGDEFGVMTLSDVHSVDEVEAVGGVCDVIQIPAFLCRQTDLVLAAGKSGSWVNVKKGQFMAPGDMGYIAEKVRSTGNEKVILTERGTSFGYGDIVLDPRSIVIMKELGYPVVLDVTHTTQRPGSGGGVTGGERRFTPYFMRVGMALGVDGIYMEVHTDPEKAISDRGSQIPLKDVAAMLDILSRES